MRCRYAWLSWVLLCPLLWACSDRGSGETPSVEPPAGDASPQPDAVAAIADDGGSEPPAKQAIDLGGAPAFAEATATCTKRSAPHVLVGAKLQKALASVRLGQNPAGADHSSLAGSCEVPAREVADAYVRGGLALYRAGSKQLSTTLFMQAVRADPSHLAGRYNLACALALAGHHDAAMGNLAELARGGQDGIGWLAKVPGDEDFDDLRSREDYLALLYPETDFEGRATELVAKGPVLPVEALPPPGKGKVRRHGEGFEMECQPRPRCEWPNFNKLLAATEPISGGTRRAYNRCEQPTYRAFERLPHAVRAKGHISPGRWSPYFYWHPGGDAVYLFVAYTLLGAGRELHGYGLYEPVEGGVKLVRFFESGRASCEGEGEQPLDMFLLTEQRDEIHEIKGCGRVVDYNRVRFHEGKLTVHSGRLQVEPGAVAAKAGAAEAAKAAAAAARPEPAKIADAPVYGPALTCEPVTGDGVADRSTVQKHLRSVARGEVPDGVDAASLLASCSVEPRAVAKAFSTGGLKRHRAQDYTASASMWTEALRADRTLLAARFNLACALSLGGRADEAVAHIHELLKVGDAGQRWIYRSLDDPDLRAARDQARYWKVIPALSTMSSESRNIYGIDERALQPSGKTIPLPRMEVPSGDVGFEKIATPNRVLANLMDGARLCEALGSATDALAEEVVPPVARRGAPRDLPSSAFWWTPAKGRSYLVMGKQGGSGICAIHLFELAGKSLRPLPGMRGPQTGCNSGTDFGATVITSTGDEIRDLSTCDDAGSFCRLRYEAGSLREVCSGIPEYTDDY